MALGPFPNDASTGDTTRPRLPELSGLVLAGGRGERMGGDKAVQRIGGQRLVDRALAVLGELTDDLLIARGDRDALRIADTREVPDAAPGVGPVGGLVAGLAAAHHDLVAVLAVDLPRASAPVLARLASAAHRHGADAAVPVVERRQPLHAVWHRTALPVLRERVASGRHCLMGALDELHVVECGPDHWSDLDPAGAFARNVNRPADLA
ncbi:molybdenum cofactor guanylyltransferase [Egibacter rhizosphaerae]|uniref:Probable molybdenum cofactor guanylyltransferase n=1 Tax=Egibacter rhizosphaerae TaxID=1670831 RepID=A0A411YJA5_9ACTN|nr:molybdenum cofactor guanylyltransferase [Egibacter rhizosphaerae]QBI21368.1 molybdenum cofactor guanylyltransferase [Egibacter rhizosphaerae]